MFVASHVASGDQAVGAVLPQIIGRFCTCVGGGTLTRTGDIVIPVMAGDAVCEGDVIETASDGQIAIGLLDGTCFMLSHDTRVVLGGLLCDPDSASPSARFAVDRGSFAFVTGPTAKTGSLRIDTPLGNIRGRTHAGGFGMLSLTALTFATMSKVNAADPDATFLDDDAIAYKDFEHGAFELWTKEAIPRLIIVGDPGETVVLAKRGSSVNISQFANSAARMEELQAAQQAVLSNYARGYGPGGSSTPSYLDLQKLQPTNLVQPAGSTAPGTLPPLPEVPNLVEPVIPPPPIPKPPTLDAATGPTLIDTTTLDHFVASGGRFVASSSTAGATLTFGISGGIAGSTELEGITYNGSIAGLYGTLYLNSATGAFVYVPDDAAINALSAPTTESFIITVSDGTLSVSQVYTVILNGVNDAAIITGAASGAITEAGGVTNAAPGAPTASGTLFDTDVDNPANTFTVVSSPTPSHQGYGRFTMTMAGEWTYTLDNTNRAVQALNVGDTLIDTFTVTTVDGTPQVITITITGSNDAAVISGVTTGAATEAGTATPGTPVATGTLTDVDVDNPSNSFTAVTSPTSSQKGYGSFTITAAGVWTYALDNSSHAVQALNAGETLTDTFTVATIDGTTQVVTITITGSNDAAIISGTITGSVTEASSTTAGIPIATGTLTAADADNAANAFTAVSSPTTSHQGYGRFTMTAAGVWTYTLDNSNPAVQALNAGATLIDTFTVATVDGTTQIVTIAIAGSNDAAIVSGTITGSVVEAGSSAAGTPVATGTLTDIDVDNAANTFTVVSSPTASHQGYGSFTMTAAGVWTYTLNNANPAVQALNAGDALTDTFTVTTVDGTTQLVTITITGSNDAAVISGTKTGSVLEAGSAATGTPTATGTLTDTDVDNAENAFIAVSTPAASHNGYGSFTMTATGVWVYTLDNSNPVVQGLNVGATLTDTFTAATLDGTTQVVTITIGGSNDAAVISGATTGSVTEAGTTTPGTPVATGTLTDIDVDNEDNRFTAITSPTATKGGYGTFTITAAGVWAYTLDNSNGAVQALDPGQTLTDTFTVTTIDGTPQTVTIVIHGSSDADPNDFDNLALGDHVVTDTPFVYGTPNGETIAGGGDEFQIVYAGAGNDTVNGTGKDDVLYSGSGNDTIKGNDGNDIIYGGSGNDTVNGNNGNDTITGGFGADRLTGSNGNDVFVYLSVADSSSTQFDTITDFSSGSDKINLAALGGLAFLHLSSTTAPVPPHTIAWIYSSASNETIVYVNPTDVARNIGDSALLEIHLQGIVSVQESDFIYQAGTNTPVAGVEAIELAQATIALTDGAIQAAADTETSAGPSEEPGTGATWSLALQTADEGFKFHFERDNSSAGSVRLARFGDTPAFVAAEGEAATAVVLIGASPAELWSQYTETPTENHFIFHQEPIQTSTSASASAASVTAIAPPVSAIELASLMVTNAVAPSQPLEYAIAPGAGAEPHLPQHEPHTAPQQTNSNNSHAPAHGVAASQLAQLGVTPGPAANHGQPQHEPHIASPPAGANEPHAAANPVATSHLAELGVTPGAGASHSQPQHEQPMAAQHASASEPHAAANPHSAANTAIASQLAQLEAPASGTLQQQPHQMHAASPQAPTHDPPSASAAPTVIGASHPSASANVGQAPSANDPSYGSSFHFNDEFVTGNTEPFVALEPMPAASSGAHGHGAGPGGPATILEAATAPSFPALDLAHANVHSHGPHELLV